MPALTSYTPYEELVFLQNVAEHGASTPSLQTISSTLIQDQLIRESDAFDASKFTIDALRAFYTSRISDADTQLPVESVNVAHHRVGHSPKPSTEVASTTRHDNARISDFVDILYAQFKEQTIRELRQQENEFQRLQSEIGNLEAQAKAQQQEHQQPYPQSSIHVANPPQAISSESTSNGTPAQRATGPVSVVTGIDVRNSTAPQPQLVVPSQSQVKLPSQPEPVDPVAAQLQADLDAAHNVAPILIVKKQPSPPKAQPALSSVPATQPDRNGHRQAGLASQPGPKSGPLPSQQSKLRVSPQPIQPYSSITVPQQQNRPSVSSVQQATVDDRPSPGPKSANHQASGSQLLPATGQSAQNNGASQSRESPATRRIQAPLDAQKYLRNQNQINAQAWPTPSRPKSRSENPHSPVQYTSQQVQPEKGPAQTADQAQSPQLPQSRTAPMSDPQHPQWQTVSSALSFPPLVTTTPLTRPSSRASLPGSGASTPWKKGTPTKSRARSPSRLEREISPLSDHDSPPPTSPKRRGRPPKQGAPGLLKQDHDLSGNKTLSEPKRAQSVLSTASDVQERPKRRPGRPPKHKEEPSSSPVAVNAGSDSEQQQGSSGRRGRSRVSIPGSAKELPATVGHKRKRETSPTPSARERVMPLTKSKPTNHVLTVSEESGLVLVSKTFGKTSQLLLTEITSHKLGGIFAKPLSERDAPGYKSLVLRPQDLKNIKAAITKGSRAAVAAIEELEVKEDNEHHMETDEVPVQQAHVNMSVPGAVGNGNFLVEATEDLQPPKGIVNFEQLETELVRMFANAVMFNPLPSTERGFGRSLRLRKRGGEPRTYASRQETSAENRETSADSTETLTETDTSDSAGEDDGIISDAREMFKDVEQLVARWREQLDGEKGGTVSGNERGVSVSASSAAAEEDDGTPAASAVGSVRKRRRVGDH